METTANSLAWSEKKTGQKMVTPENRGQTILSDLGLPNLGVEHVHLTADDLTERATGSSYMQELEQRRELNKEIRGLEQEKVQLETEREQIIQQRKYQEKLRAEKEQKEKELA